MKQLRWCVNHKYILIFVIKRNTLLYDLFSWRLVSALKVGYHQAITYRYTSLGLL
jgi:hypothetical protein